MEIGAGHTEGYLPSTRLAANLRAFCDPMTERTEFWCYIEGQRDIFGLSILPHRRIDNLKDEIYTIKGSASFVGCNAMDLTLTKERLYLL